MWVSACYDLEPLPLLIHLATVVILLVVKIFLLEHFFRQGTQWIKGTVSSEVAWVIRGSCSERWEPVAP